MLGGPSTPVLNSPYMYWEMVKHSGPTAMGANLNPSFSEEFP